MASGNDVFATNYHRHRSTHHRWGYGRHHATTASTYHGSGPLPRYSMVKATRIGSAASKRPGYYKVRLKQTDIIYVVNGPVASVVTSQNPYTWVAHQPYSQDRIVPFAAAPVTGFNSPSFGFTGWTQPYPSDLSIWTGIFNRLDCSGSAITVRVMDMGINMGQTGFDYDAQEAMMYDGLRVFVMPWNSPTAPFGSVPTTTTTDEDLQRLITYRNISWSKPGTDSYYPSVFATVDYYQMYAFGDKMMANSAGAAYPRGAEMEGSFGYRYVQPLMQDYPLYWHIGVHFPTYDVGELIDPVTYPNATFACTLEVTRTYDVVLSRPSFLQLWGFTSSSQFDRLFLTNNTLPDDRLSDEQLHDVDILDAEEPTEEPTVDVRSARTVAPTARTVVDSIKKSPRNWATVKEQPSPKRK